jgi:hypothetical protein
MKKKTGLFKDFFGTIRRDLKETNLKTSLRDLRAVYEFYLSAKERQELATMGWFRRWLYRVFWIIINILKKLSPFRALLLLLSIIFLFDMENRSRMLAGYLVLFLILLLELKDKLLAHDELKAGRAVQAALRPQSCPSMSGWDAFIGNAMRSDDLTFLVLKKN